MDEKLSIKDRCELKARRQLLDELFNDFYGSRHRIYRMNFFRGICFGFGSVLGGTALVAIIVWILTQIAGWFPFIGEFINKIVNAIQ
jgi:hypothetical protein